jgi:transcriptional regulator with XRE-family HTH domain
MNLAEIQYFRQIGKRLRNAREMRGITLPVIANSCGLAISELVRIENGELLEFKQAPTDTMSNARAYAKVLDVELEGLRGQYSRTTTITAKNDEVYIPAFLRKK